MNTLIVDDNILNCKFLDSLLENTGTRSLALDGASAITQFKNAHKESSPFDLICLDIMLPDIDGSEVLKFIRKFEQDNNIAPVKRCRIVMITALGEVYSNAKKNFYEGCDGYILKPVEHSILFEVLKKIGLQI